MFNDGLGKSLAAIADIAHCTSVTDAFDVQARYASNALADWLNSSRRLAEVLGEVVREEFAAAGEIASMHVPVEKKPVTGGRRAA